MLSKKQWSWSLSVVLCVAYIMMVRDYLVGGLSFWLICAATCVLLPCILLLLRIYNHVQK